MKKLLSAITVFALILSIMCSCDTNTVKKPDSTTELFGDVLFGDVYMLRSTKSFGTIYYTSVYDDTMLITYERDKQYNAMFYDLKNGEIVSDVRIDLSEYFKGSNESDVENDGCYSIQLMDDKTAYITVGNKAHLFNNKLKYIRTIDAGKGINNIFALGGYIWSTADCILTKYDSNGQPHKYNVDNAYMITPCEMNGNKAVFSCTDKYSSTVYLSLDTESGKYERSFPALSVSSFYRGGAIYDYDNETIQIRRTDPNTNLAPTVYNIEDRTNWVSAADDKYFYVDHQINGNQGLAKYSVSSGQLCDKLVIENNSKLTICLSTFSAFIYSDSVIFPVYYGDQAYICLWKSGDLSGSNSFKSYGDRKKYEINYMSADEMCGKYNIGVYYGENASEHNFTDYTVEPLNDSAQLKSAISDVLSVLDKTPDGFVNELIDGFNGFDLYLCSTMHPVSASSISSAAGFTCIEDNRIVVAIDATQGGIAQTFAHEFMHCIEDSINNNHITIPFPDWSDYNPKDFGYNYSYDNTDGVATGWGYDTKYTAESDEAINYDGSGDKCPDIYFVDGYAKTYPSEDRARIFEHLFCDEDQSDQYLKFDKLRAKANYLCQSLRECFDTLKNCDSIYWERNLKSKAAN